MAIVTGLVHLAHDPGETTGDGPTLASPAGLQPEPLPHPSPVRLRPFFALEPAGPAGLPVVEARRTAAGGQMDLLRLGAFDDPGPHLQLEAERFAETEPAPASFFLETARRASGAGLGVARSAQPFVVATKLGPAEVAAVQLAGTAERSCLAFRLRHEGGLGLGGWLCGPPDRPAEAKEAACVIDRLVVAPGAEDAPLRALFAKAEHGRDPACGPPAATTQSDPQTAPFSAPASGRKRDKPGLFRSASSGQRS